MNTVDCPACGEGTLARSSRLSGSAISGRTGTGRETPDQKLLAKCINCGAEFGSAAEEFYLLFAGLFENAGEGILLKNGLRGELRGKEYEITGFTVFVSEEEPATPCFTEWHAAGSDGGRVVFTEESGFVYLYRITDLMPAEYDPESGSLFFDGKKISLKKKGKGALLRGQSPEGVRAAFEGGKTANKRAPGEVVAPVPFKKNGRYFMAWISGKSASVAMGERIPFVEFMLAFREPDFRDQYGYTILKRRLYFRKALIYAAGAFAALSFIVYGFFSGGETGGIMDSGTPVVEKKSVSEESGFYISQILYGPFLTGRRDNSLFRLEISLDEAAFSTAEPPPAFRVFLIEEKRLRRHVDDPENISELERLFDEIDALEEPLESYMIVFDFNRKRFYAGGKSGEPGHLKKSDLFMLERAGRYYILLEKVHRPGEASRKDISDRGSPGKKGSEPLSGGGSEFDSVILTLNSVSGQRYFGTAFIVLSLFSLVNFKKSRSYSELPFPINGGIS